MMRAVIFLTLLVAAWIRPAFADYLDDPRLQAILRSVSAPKLVYPSNEEIDISEKAMVDFHWALYSSSLVSRERVEFRLYKGEKQSKEGLIVTKELGPDTFSLQLSSGLFEDGGVYVWSITQYFLRSDGVGESAASFKVIKTDSNPKPAQ